MTLALRDLQGRGGTGYAYRITVEPIVPSFEITLNDLQVSIPRNGTAAVGVTVARKGYNGPIALSVANPPAGVTVRPGTIADGQAVGSFTVSASPDAAFGAVTLQVVGTGQGPGGPIVRAATKDDRLRPAGDPHGDPPHEHVDPDRPGGRPRPGHGGQARRARRRRSRSSTDSARPIEVKAERSAGADAALAVTPLPLPPGLAVPAVNIAEKAATGSVTVTAAPEVPLGPMTIALTAKGKIANAEQVFAVPAVTLNVVRPAAITLAAPSAEVKAGATVEVKGKVERKAPFKEPVTVKVDGAPRRPEGRPGDRGPDGVGLHAQDRRRPQGGRGIGGRRASRLASRSTRKIMPLPPPRSRSRSCRRADRGRPGVGHHAPRGRERTPYGGAPDVSIPLRRPGDGALPRGPRDRPGRGRPEGTGGRAGEAEPPASARSASSRTWRRSWSRTASPATTPGSRRASTP